MAVRMMVSKDRANEPGIERVDNYPGSESWRMSHESGCPHRNDHAYDRERGPNCGEWCRCFDPLYMETTWVGCVIRTWERNGYDDSDFYATVWDDAAGELREIEYATTRGWSYPNGAWVDATPEVLAKVAAYRAAVAEKARLAEEAEKAKFPSVGKRVKIVRGRKIAKGRTGTVVWLGKNNFCRTYNPLADAMGFYRYDAKRYRVGIRFDDTGAREFTAASNVEVLAEELVFS